MASPKYFMNVRLANCKLEPLALANSGVRCRAECLTGKMANRAQIARHAPTARRAGTGVPTGHRTTFPFVRRVVRPAFLIGVFVDDAESKLNAIKASGLDLGWFDNERLTRDLAKVSELRAEQGQLALAQAKAEEEAKAAAYGSRAGRVRDACGGADGAA